MSLFDRAAYRSNQLFRSIRPRVSAPERAEARRVLGPGLYPLFASMQPGDQRHCLDVFRHLTAGGCTDEEMLRAGLIHDAGKGRLAGGTIGVHHRVLFVLLQHAPRAIEALAKYDRGLRALRDHDRRTVELAEEYGASPGVIRLLRAMDGVGTDERTAALIAADNRS